MKAQLLDDQGHVIAVKPHANPYQAPHGGHHGEHQNGRFAARDGCRDPIWAILFVLQLIGMIAVSIYFFNKVKNDPATSEVGQDLKLDGDHWGLIAIFCVTGGIFSGLWLLAIQRFASGIIWFTLLFAPVMWGIFALVYFAYGFVVPGVLFLIIGLLNLLYAYLVRGRVPFAAAMLETVVEVVRLYPATVTTAMLSIIFQAAWLLVWLMGAASLINSMDQSDESSGRRNLVYFLLLISFYWTSQVIKNIVHVTTAGVFASWYFLSPHAVPENPTLKSFKRASWTSLGSIAFGSFIIAILKALRTIAEGGRRNRNGFVRCCFLCILGCLERMMLYFNLYAFTHVAVYGNTYCEAASATWQLILSRGFDMLINDNLIGAVLTLGSFIVALVTGAVGVIFAYKVWGFDDWVLWVIAGVLVGFAISIVAMEVIESSVAACFVCFAEDPAALQNTKPAFYNRLNNAFESRLGYLRQQQQQEDQAQ